MAAGNPFHYGSPAQGEFFTGRRSELEALVARMRDGINVVLVSPRRYGKTSLHRAAQAQLARARPAGAALEISLLRAGSPAAFASLLASGTFHLPGARWSRPRQAISEFVRRLRLAPTVTLDAGGKAQFNFDPSLDAPNMQLVLADVYRLLAEEARHRPAALILDEFQAVDLIDRRLPDVLKALSDENPAVSLVVAGSRRHLMERLVSEAAAPLYGMLQTLPLGPIPEGEMRAYLTERAGGGKRPMAEATADYLLGIAGPVPNDIQHLAYDAFEAAVVEIDGDAVDIGMSRAVEHSSTLFAEAFGRLSAGQAKVLREIALDPPSEPYSAGFARRVGLASGSSVRKALQPLLEEDTVVPGGPGLVVADPFFAAWLRGAS